MANTIIGYLKCEMWSVWSVCSDYKNICLLCNSVAESGRVEAPALRWICHPLHVAGRGEEEMD